ncbi:hypothetical protein GCM10022415_02460 [Knoellia locipacati]|uniref:ESX-1 secretion-associated protein n=1 Tax=Knoellia locipacati TaxID=882824 RepID=A0A512SW68_9MICO|nr:type VII secretion target [Knoellia locipacati]GEQ12199.1 hypothetical protein KLO01_02460 [Knoellia locipacati]
MTQFDVRPDDIGGHANEVASLSARLSTASSAGQTTLDSSAFGLVNVFLATAATGLAGIAQGAISNSSKDMTETMRNLRQVVKQYESDDTGASNRVIKAGER